MKIRMKAGFSARCVIPFLILTVCTADGLCELVSTREAIAVADLWYAMELNSGHLKMEAEEKAARLADLSNREVLYLLSKDDLQAEPPGKGEGPVLAYIVKYKPNGFVVVSGEDRIEPVLVFNAQGIFRFDTPEHNFMPHYLANALIGRWDNLRQSISAGKSPQVHTQWNIIRSRMRQYKDLTKAVFSGGNGNRSTYVYWDTPTWYQYEPYNDTVTPNNGGIPGIPTGCVATAMAIKMRFHEWPLTGNGQHDYDDDEGDVQFHHSVNFGAQSYNWSAMPTHVLDPDKAYPEVADLMYHCGVAMETDYEVGGSSADTSAAPGAMEDYFRYYGDVWNTSNQEPDLANSIIGGLPALIRYPGHAMVACGYRDDTLDKHFFINMGWNGSSNGWYDLTDVNGKVIAGSGPYSQPLGWIYVDLNWTGPEIGLFVFPFNTLYEGNNAVPSGGCLMIRGGTYTGAGNTPIEFKKPMKIRNYAGWVVMK